MEENKKKYNNNMRKYRLEKKLSLADLEKLTGISDTQLSKMERGERKIPSAELAKICNALAVDPMTLLGMDDYEFEVAEVFSREDIEFLRMMKELNEFDKSQLMLFISFLIYQHKAKLHEVGGQ